MQEFPIYVFTQMNESEFKPSIEIVFFIYIHFIFIVVFFYIGYITLIAKTAGLIYQLQKKNLFQTY